MRTNKQQPNDKTPPRGRAPRTARHQYSEQQRLAAVTAMVLANRDHPLSYASIHAARNALGEEVHTSTLDDWYKLLGKEVLASLPTLDRAQVVTDTADNILTAYQEIRRKGLERAKDDSVINEAKFDKLMLGIGIAQTKIDEMTGLSPDESATMIAWVRVCQAAGVDAIGVLRAQIDKLQARMQAVILADDAAPGTRAVSVAAHGGAVDGGAEG